MFWSLLFIFAYYYSNILPSSTVKISPKSYTANFYFINRALNIPLLSSNTVRVSGPENFKYPKTNKPIFASLHIKIYVSVESIFDIEFEGMRQLLGKRDFIGTECDVYSCTFL